MVDDPIITQADGVPTVVSVDPDVPYLYRGRTHRLDQADTDPIYVGGGEHADELGYVDLEGEVHGSTFVHKAIVPWRLAADDTDWRDKADLVDTAWPYRLVALTVYSDPLHPRISDVIVHPVYGVGDHNFAPNAGGNIPGTTVDIEAGLPQGLAIAGDEQGIIGPNYYAR